MIKGIIFDMDGTIWDSSENVAKSWDIIIKQFGYESHTITQSDIMSIMGKTMDVITDIIFDFIPEKQLRKSVSKVCQEFEIEYLYEHGATLYPDVLETLEMLKKMGYKLYIVSNCQSGYIESFLKLYTDGTIFDDIECYGNTQLSKGENIKLICKRNQIDKAIYVGDTQGDYDSTCEAGLPFVHAKYGFGSISDNVPYISSFKELIEVAQSILG